VHPICRFVGWEGEGTLDKILAETPIPRNFDLLSIDIDGNDWHVWKAVEEYRPSLVIVEFNPTMPTELDYVQPADFGTQIGSSLRAFDRLARSKGYELVCVTQWNAIFVDAPLFPLFNITDNRIETMRTDTSMVTHFFSGFDGRIRLDGYRKLPWHDVLIAEDDVQVLPKSLQVFPDQMGKFKQRLTRLVRRWARSKFGD
jgi:hypothetical protein